MPKKPIKKTYKNYTIVIRESGWTKVFIDGKFEVNVIDEEEA